MSYFCISLIEKSYFQYANPIPLFAKGYETAETLFLIQWGFRLRRRWYLSINIIALAIQRLPQVIKNIKRWVCELGKTWVYFLVLAGNASKFLNL